MAKGLKSAEAELRITVDAELAKQILGQVDDKIKVIEKSTKGNAKTQNKLNSILDEGKAKWSLYTGGVFAAIGVAKEFFAALQAGFEMAKRGAKSIEISDAFDRAFKHSEDVLSILEKASGFRIPTTDLQRIAKEGKTAGLSVQEIAQMMELATKASSMLNIEASEAADKVINSFTKGTFEGLEALKVRVSLQEAYSKEAIRLGKINEKLTRQEIQAGNVREALLKMQAAYGDVDLSEGPGAQLSQIEKRYADAMSVVEESWSHLFVASIEPGMKRFELMGRGFDDFVNKVNVLAGRSATEAEKAHQAAIKEEFDRNVAIQKKVIAGVKILGDAYHDMSEAERSAALATHAKRLADEVHIDQIKKKESAQDELNEKTLAAALNVGDWNTAATAAEALHKRLVSSFRTLGGSMDDVSHRWDEATEKLKTIETAQNAFIAHRADYLMSLVQEGKILPTQTKELKRLREQMASNAAALKLYQQISFDATDQTKKSMKITKQVIIDEQEHAKSKANSAFEAAHAALELNNYELAMKHATNAVNIGKTAGERYRNVSIEERNALIKLTKAELDRASAILETVQAKAVAEQGGFTAAYLISTEYKKLVEEIDALESLKKSLQKEGTTKPPKEPKAPRSRSGESEAQKEWKEYVKGIKDRQKLREDYDYWRVQRNIDATRDDIESTNKQLEPHEQYNRLIKLHAYASEEWADQIKELEKMDPLQRVVEGPSRFEQALNEIKDAATAKMDEINSILKSMNEAMLDAQMESIHGALGMAADAGSAFAAQMSQAISELEVGWQRAKTTYDSMIAAGKTEKEAITKAAPGAIAASGKVMAAFSKDEAVKAKIMAAVEAAAALTAFATGNYYGGTMHTLASIAYAAAAKEAGGSATKAKPPPARASTTATGGQQRSNVINLHFAGSTIIGNDQTAGEQLANIIGQHSQWQNPNPGFEAA